MEALKNWMKDAANILFDDSKNDLRSLPRSVRLQILLVLSFVWTTVFSLYIFSYTTFAFGWAGLYVAHIGLIFAVYMTFKHFHKAEAQSSSVFQTKNFDPFNINGDTINDFFNLKNIEEVNSYISVAREKEINGVPFFEIGTDFVSGAQSSTNLEVIIRSNLS